MWWFEYFFRVIVFLSEFKWLFQLIRGCDVLQGHIWPLLVLHPYPVRVVHLNLLFSPFALRHPFVVRRAVAALHIRVLI